MSERLLDLRALVRARFARDLKSLASISEESEPITLDELLDALHTIYVNYLQQNTLLNSASNTKYIPIKEEINRLKQID